MISRRQLLRSSASAMAVTLVSSNNGVAADIAQPLNATLEEIRKRMGVPALGAIVVSRDKVVARGEAGVRRVDEDGSVSPEAHWQIGSITKTFTATLTALLVERGKLSWDTTLRQLYPEHVKVMAPGVADVTIREIVTHRSGMPRGDIFGWEGVAEINRPGLSLSQRRQGAATLALKAPLEFKPGSKTSYSNRAYNLLGAAIEKVGGGTWEDLILREIAMPLGMTSVTFGEPALYAAEREPWPHVMERGRWKAVPPVPRESYGYHIFNPAGGLALTLADFGRWMQAHMNGEISGGILSQAMFKSLHMAEDRGGARAFALGNHSMGRTLSHGGSNGRNSAMGIVFPDEGVGLFLGINAAASTPIQASHLVWNTLYATAFPGRWPLPLPSSHHSRTQMERLRARRSNSFVHLEGLSTFNDPKAYRANFSCGGGGAKDGDSLVLRLNVPRKGRYAVEAIFGRNIDYGSSTFAFGPILKRIDFRAEKLAWDTISIGDGNFEAGSYDLTVTAHGNAGDRGINCHLGLDLLKLRLLAPLN